MVSDKLEQRWNRLWERIGTSQFSKSAYEELVSFYGESHRAYHTLTHIKHVLKELDEVSRFLENPDQVEVALWYHDIIYDTKTKNSEERSSELAEKRLTEVGIDEQFIAGVKAMILSTKHREHPKDRDTKYLIDIDLSILGKPEKEFDEYERGIVFEYAWVPEEQFRQGRRTVLQGFLDRDSIYSTDLFRNKYESQARSNLERSIAQLS